MTKRRCQQNATFPGNCAKMGQWNCLTDMDNKRLVREDKNISVGDFTCTDVPNTPPGKRPQRICKYFYDC